MAGYSRPAVSEQRLALTSYGQVRYELKTPNRNGTTHVIFQPLDFIAKLAALVPKPRVNLTRFHGVFAPNSKHRGQITPAKGGKKTSKVQAGGADWLDKIPETASCHDLDAAPQARVQYRYRNL